ncbi:MAG: ABC transporter permease [Myxococcaceae bacterium]|nr:MAG: ABC transporter permease [Myxococcaceae bacterium]
MSVAAVAHKELRQLSRDPRSLMVLVVLPAVMTLLFGTVLSLDVRHVPISVLDRDGTASSRALVAALTSGEYFELAGHATSDSELDALLLAGKVTIALVVPKGLERSLVTGGRPAVRAVVDGSNAISAQTALGYLEQYVTDFGARLDGERPEPLLSARLRVLFNPELASDRFLLPGLMAMILMVSATIATALSIVKERESGTMEQLRVSPLSAAQVVLGKAMPYSVVSLLAAVLVMATAWLAFGLVVRGSLLLLLLLAGLFVVGAQGLGLVISSVTRSQQVAFQLASYSTLLPSFIISGFVFPLRSMPRALQLLSAVLPVRYFISGLRGVVLKGAGLAVIWPEVAALALFATAMLGLAIWRLHRSEL